MSGFSNADTGSKPADPYKERNLDDASIEEKVESQSEFVSNCKFGMMTTRDGSTGDWCRDVWLWPLRYVLRKPPYIRGKSISYLGYFPYETIEMSLTQRGTRKTAAST